MTQQQTLNRVDVSRYETVSQLAWLDLILFDSIVELSPRDTVSRTRHVRAQIALRDSCDQTATYTRTDTAAVRQTQVVVDPIAAESIKKRGSVALRHVRTALGVFFLIFFAILLLIVKKNVFLRHK